MEFDSEDSLAPPPKSGDKSDEYASCSGGIVVRVHWYCCLFSRCHLLQFQILQGVLHSQFVVEGVGCKLWTKTRCLPSTCAVSYISSSTGSCTACSDVIAVHCERSMLCNL